MKRYLLVFLVPLFFGCKSNNRYSSTLPTSDNFVIICLGSGAYAYHNHECQGLNQCEADTMHVTIEGAKSKGRGKPCGYCY